MDIILLGILFGLAVFFYLAGGYLRNATWLFIGAAFFLFFGVASFSGISYNTFNQTTTTFAFSSDYFEFANDTVICSNCTNSTFDPSFNATPPGCCEHDVNTTINGQVSQAVQYQIVPVELAITLFGSTIEIKYGVGLIFVLLGVLTMFELGLAWNAERGGD